MDPECNDVLINYTFDTTTFYCDDPTSFPPLIMDILEGGQGTKQSQYPFPPSPPSSGNATALSSPRLPTIVPQTDIVIQKLLSTDPSFHKVHHQSTDVLSHPRRHTIHATDLDDHNTKVSSHSAFLSKRVHKNIPNHLYNVESGSAPQDTLTAQSPTKSFRFRRSPSVASSSSSSSTPSSPTDIPSHPSTSGMGRKVAATLQLFKETASEDTMPPEPSSRTDLSAGRRSYSFSRSPDVAEAQFEFVKRSEWPDREAAAMRRERSSTTLERKGPQDPNDRTSLVRDPNLSEPRKDLGSRQDAVRGRKRERLDEALNNMNGLDDHPTSIPGPPPPFIRRPSRVYPPSPSPSRPPASRIPPSPITRDTENFDPRGSTPTNKTHAYPHPIRPAYNATKSSKQPYYVSPWSTDDDSAWETASTTTSTSNTSTTSPSAFSPSEITPPSEDSHNLSLLYTGSHFKQKDNSTDEGHPFNENFVANARQTLPHIPLRPFRNQVGGHSAIYKFTKQAVCKVCNIPRFLYVMKFIEHPLSSAPCVA